MTTARHRSPEPPTAHRLFAAHGPGLAEHLRQFGAMPASAGTTLAATVDRARLTGRGGAGFPTGRKIASVTGEKAVVIGNGAEGEPLSFKDAALLSRAPHLVLDGLNVAADAVSADQVYLYVPSRVMSSVRAALDERTAARLDRHRVAVVEAPERFVAGEESAVVRRIEGGPALPRDRIVVTSKSGVRGRPTLINNVETLAHIALIARYGPDWFQSVGEAAQPGTMLVTLSGALNKCRVAEVPTGAPLEGVIGRLGFTDPRTLRAILIGGYHGAWIPTDASAGARLSQASLAPLGASPGAGIVHGLGRDECGLARTADIADYLADQGARQCGPCLNGLPRLAHLLNELAYGTVDDDLLIDIHRMVDLVDGRGSCRHPEGTARLIRSALSVFAVDVALHANDRCEVDLTSAPGTADSGPRRIARHA
jgi:NADH:ubiquinone oxidoreductase subunit F (NADH-binding)